MDVSDAKRLKVLEDENAKLKRLLAEAMLDNTALKDLMPPKQARHMTAPLRSLLAQTLLLQSRGRRHMTALLRGLLF